MNPQADWDAARFMMDGQAVLKEMGVARIRLSNDFEEYKKIMLKVRGKLSEHFDIDYIDTLEQEGVWFMCVDRRGNHIANQALRFEDLRGVSLTTALKRRLQRIHGGVAVQSHPVLDNFTGRVAYHGDVWIRREYRKQKLAPVFGRILQAYAFLKFDPEIVYGLMIEDLVRSGYCARLGYVHSQLYCHGWEKEPDFKRPRYVTWLSREDLVWQCEESLEKLAAA